MKEQEPMAWMYNGNLHEFDPSDWAVNKVTPLYAAPPEREWQGLTDEEIKEIVGPWGGEPIKGYTRELINKIEAKLKEKNT